MFGRNKNQFSGSYNSGNKKSKVGIIRWIFGVFIILGNLGVEEYGILTKTLGIFTGMSILPVTWKLIRKKINVRGWQAFFVGMTLMFAWAGTAPETDTNTESVAIAQNSAGEESELDKLSEDETEKENVVTETGVQESTAVEDLTTLVPPVTEDITKQVTTLITELASMEMTEEQPTVHMSAENITESTTMEETVTQIETKKTYDMTVHFLDVGQGLAILAQSGGMNMVYDGGDRETSRYVVSYLKKQGVTTIDYLISSHYDSDHVYGLIGCLNAFTVKNVIASNYEHDSQTYTKFIDAVDNAGLECHYPDVGTIFTFGTGSFTVLGPESIDKNDSNANSVVIKLVNGENSFIFTGDAESVNETEMINSGLDLSCDVLVLGHHGSATATSWSFLENTIPEYAIISAGVGNSYGHPHEETMEKLESMEIEIFRTDKQGEIVATSNGKKIKWNKKSSKDYSSGEEEEITKKKNSGSSSSGNSNSSGGSNSTGGTNNSDNSSPSGDSTNSSGTSSVQVWISETGSKYHSVNDCGNMNPNKAYQMSKDAAEASGYDACGRCY